MFVDSEADIVGFSFGSKGDVFDAAVFKNGSNYVSMHDETSEELRRVFYAVMLHGWVNSVAPATAEGINFNPKQLASRVRACWQEKGKNRAILLISCFTGLGFARQFGKELNLPVVAPRSSAYVNPFGAIVSAEEPESVRNPTETTSMRGISMTRDVLGYHVPNRPDWIFCHPGGQIEVLPGGSQLDKRAAIARARRYIITL